MGNAQANTTTSESGPKGTRAVLLFSVLGTVMIADFVSFGHFWLGQALTCGDWTQMGNNLRSSVWPEFLLEAQYYAEQNLSLVNPLLDKYLAIDRVAAGNSGPFIDYLFQKLFRAAGFLSYMAGGLIVILFMAAEAYRRNKEKRLNFEKQTATAYHFALYAGSLFSACFFFLFLFMPGRLVIPGLLEAQVPFVLYNPFFWAAAMTVVTGCTIYGMISNITNA